MYTKIAESKNARRRYVIAVLIRNALRRLTELSQNFVAIRPTAYPGILSHSARKLSDKQQIRIAERRSQVFPYSRMASFPTKNVAASRLRRTRDASRMLLEWVWADMKTNLMCGSVTARAADQAAYDPHAKELEMLVLTRKVGERIVIGNSIMVTILESQGGRIRLGIDAPHEVPVYREEIRKRFNGLKTQKILNARPNRSPYFPEFA
jgi:carbon storage regulator